MSERWGHKKGEMRRELAPLAVGHCYHCETKKVTNVFCDLWEVWACMDCLARHHMLDHEDCKDPASKVAFEGAEPRRIYLSLTRYDGQMVSFMCQTGVKLEMEEHWLGTYVFFPGAMVLVLEDRAAINELILKALQVAPLQGPRHP